MSSGRRAFWSCLWPNSDTPTDCDSAASLTNLEPVTISSPPPNPSAPHSKLPHAPPPGKEDVALVRTVNTVVMNAETGAGLGLRLSKFMTETTMVTTAGHVRLICDLAKKELADTTTTLLASMIHRGHRVVYLRDSAGVDSITSRVVGSLHANKCALALETKKRREGRTDIVLTETERQQVVHDLILTKTPTTVLFKGAGGSLTEAVHSEFATDGIVEKKPTVFVASNFRVCTEEVIGILKTCEKPLQTIVFDDKKEQVEKIGDVEIISRWMRTVSGVEDACEIEIAVMAAPLE